MTAQVLDVIEPVETAELPVLEFVAPIPGFAQERCFVLVRVDDAGMLYSLTSVDRPELRFLVAPPAPFFPDYSVDVDDEVLEALGGPDADELLVLLVITPATGRGTPAPTCWPRSSSRSAAAGPCSWFSVVQDYPCVLPCLSDKSGIVHSPGLPVTQGRSAACSF